MKNKFGSTIQNQLLGQAILDLIFEKKPINEQSLIEKLETMRSRVMDPVEEQTLKNLIDEIHRELHKLSDLAELNIIEDSLNPDFEFLTSQRVQKHKLH